MTSIGTARFAKSISCLLLTWLTVFAYYILFTMESDRSIYRQIVSTLTTLTDETSRECRVPKLQPFDPSIYDLVKDFPKPLKCHQHKYPILFNSSVYPYPHVFPAKTEEEFTALGIKECYYRNVVRPKVGMYVDSSYHIEDAKYPVSLERSTKVPHGHDYIMINCEFAKSRKSRNRNQTPRIKIQTEVVDMHVFVHEKLPEAGNEYEESPRLGQSDAPSNSPKLNVIILGIDSVSRMGFLRSMPESYRFLLEELNAVEMMRYHKIGDNTFPNVGPMLTNLPTIDESVLPCEHDRYFDNCTFLWNMFEKAGYSTLYAEDDYALGIFNLDKLGFITPPTNYYLRPFLSAAEYFIGHHKEKFTKACYGPRSSFQVMVKFMQQLSYMSRKQGRKYFQFVWSSAVTHDIVNGGRLIDADVRDTLKWWKKGGYLNDTLLIVISDHGIRWGEFRNFYQGQLEDRLPFMYVVVSPWFRETYPMAYQNLMDNKNRLVSMLDLHQTLRHVLNTTNFSLPWKPTFKENELKTGLSLFQRIPRTRSCETAGIPEGYCTCNHKMKTLSVYDNWANLAANFAVQSINAMIGKFKQCAFLALEAILQVRKVKFGPIKKQKGNWEGYQLSFQTTPGNATFEAFVMWDGLGHWSLSGQIARTNMYGNQSHCVSVKRARLYCYCLDLIDLSFETSNGTQQF